MLRSGRNPRTTLEFCNPMPASYEGGPFVGYIAGWISFSPKTVSPGNTRRNAHQITERRTVSRWLSYTREYEVTHFKSDRISKYADRCHGNEIGSTTIVEPLTWKMEFTMHIRGELNNPYTLEAKLFYPMTRCRSAIIYILRKAASTTSDHDSVNNISMPKTLSRSPR